MLPKSGGTSEQLFQKEIEVNQLPKAEYNDPANDNDVASDMVITSDKVTNRKLARVGGGETSVESLTLAGQQ